MKRQLLISIAILMFAFFSANAHVSVVVQHGDSVQVYNSTNLNQAITNAQAGSIVYLSGGNFTLSITINKPLHFIGAGHNPAMTVATMMTTIESNIFLSSDASNSSFIGLHMPNSDFRPSANCNNVYIYRCNFQNITAYGTISSWIVEENILRFVGTIGHPIYIQHSHFFKNIIHPSSVAFSHLTSSHIFNNILIGSNSLYAFMIVNYCNIRNNIFGYLHTNFLSSGTNNTIINNITSNPQFVINQTPNFTNNNLTNVPLDSLFMNYPTSNPPFNYGHDFRLLPGSVGINFGNDSTDVGIYGTIKPAKIGSLPFNPHIQNATVSTTTVNGGLNINIKVQAQDE